ncbi:c-type cytochrome [Pseudothauera rhizosphaerae]|uniref:C-type cytochrome n=1 Tax=Pseudothauera rhizosphaerae TaxID=2565932 RepID=A0A4S4AQY9_9RHOO|nr:c-type cytochrome [Pseudothauera rhizosphaerae]THF60856.1 c-type cytochrome [Pseudothauera rhizosphaerae]
MRRILQTMALAACLTPLGAAANPPPEVAAIFKAHNCTVCHLLAGRTVVGPAYTEIATRYADDKTGALPVLSERVRKGSDAKLWGQAPMPPSPNISEADADAAVKWILGL